MCERCRSCLFDSDRAAAVCADRVWTRVALDMVTVTDALAIAARAKLFEYFLFSLL